MEILIKVQEDSYIEDMYNNEYLYFSCIEDFRNNLNLKFSERDDRNEGVAKITQSTIKKITNTETKKILYEGNIGMKGQLREFYDMSSMNICSLYRAELTKDYTTKDISDKLLELGSKAIVIILPKEFERILDESLESAGFNFKRGPVGYYNPKTFNGELTFHNKEEQYQHQKEYRIAIKSNSKGAIKLSLKGLKKISCVVKTEDIIKGIKIRFVS